MTEQPILNQGAESRLYIGDYNGAKCIIKERFVKKYRHPYLDQRITKRRMKAENSNSGRCKNAGIKVPTVLHTDFTGRKIYMEYFDKAITCKEYMKKIEELSEPEHKLKLTELCTRIGTVLGKLHANHIIHGDLTTSNILVNPVTEDFREYELVLIDFGLSYFNKNSEDKGVDLYVLERALLSSHSNEPWLFEEIIQSYKKENVADEKVVLSRFEQVRARGRKRTMVG